jgi:hypothetical protein
MSKSASPQSDEIVQVRVPFSIHKRGGRKLVVVPGAAALPERPRVDNAIVKAIARAFRWRKLLESGAYGTIEELAKAEKINASYVSRILRLTLLAPTIVEQILAGHQNPKVTLFKFMQPFALAWGQQLRGSNLEHSSQPGSPTSRSSDKEDQHDRHSIQK